MTKIIESVRKHENNYPDIIAEKSVLKKMQMIPEKPRSRFMNEIRPHIVRFLKSLKGRCKEGNAEFIAGGGF